MSVETIYYHNYYIFELDDEKRNFFIEEVDYKPNQRNLAKKNFETIIKIYEQNFEMVNKDDYFPLRPELWKKRFSEFILLDVATEIRENYEDKYFHSCCCLIKLFKKFCSIFPWTQVNKIRKAYKRVCKAYEKFLKVTSVKLKEHLNNPNRFDKWYELNDKIEALYDSLKQRQDTIYFAQVESMKIQVDSFTTILELKDQQLKSLSELQELKNARIAIAENAAYQTKAKAIKELREQLDITPIDTEREKT